MARIELKHVKYFYIRDSAVKMDTKCVKERNEVKAYFKVAMKSMNGCIDVV